MLKYRGILTLRTFLLAFLVLSVVAGTSSAAVIISLDRVGVGDLVIERGEEVVWVAGTLGSPVALWFVEKAGVPQVVRKGLSFRAWFDQPGTYEYIVHRGAGKAGALRGRVIVK